MDQLLVVPVVLFPLLTRFPDCVLWMLLQVIIHSHDRRGLFARDEAISCQTDEVVNDGCSLDIRESQLGKPKKGE